MIKYKIEKAPLADHYVVVAKDRDTNEVIETFTLNESGVDMLDLYCQGKDTATVVREMADMYEVLPEKIIKDVKTFEDRLLNLGILGSK